jgi:hypothetical protein
MPDASSVAGNAIGGIGLFIQLFDKCTTAFSTWQQSDKLGSDTMVFQVRLEMQNARLQEWAVNWGIGQDPRQLHLLEPRFRKYGDLAVKYVATVNYLLNSLGSATSVNSVFLAGKSFPLTEAGHIARLDQLQGEGPDELGPLLDKIASIRDEATVIERFNWANDEAKANQSLDVIEKMITNLYEFFEPPRRDTAAHIVLNSSLTSSNIPQLDKLKDQCKDDPLLSGLAYLKSATTGLKDRATALDHVKVNQKWRFFKEDIPADNRNKRGAGRYNGTEVLVEWKSVTLAPSATRNNYYGLVLGQRVKNLARLLKVDLKPVELRTLDCLGVIEEQDNQGSTCRYGLLFKPPQPESRTLLSIINHDDFEFDLDERFSLSYQLTKSVLFLHLSGWLHKGLRSDNILCFGNNCDRIAVNDPYIVGFEYSRQSGSSNQTEGVLDDLEFNLYRHPDVQGLPEEPVDNDAKTAVRQTRPPYAQKYDVYSLGVILLEIGVLRSAYNMYDQAQRQQEYGTHSAERFSTWLRDKEVPKLGRIMGRTYRDVVLRCLSGNLADDAKMSPETALYMSVLRPLGTCRVG